MDEMHVRVGGVTHRLWRAVDEYETSSTFSFRSTAIHELRPKKPINAKNHIPKAMTVRRRYSGENSVAIGF